tara:strand:+ start:445 stop:876 length:432 start_codon:yes stop_codon:yes gene_type:complete
MEIQNCEGYLIYPDGRVSSKRFKSRFLKQYERGGGYYSVKLNKKNFLVHRLVAIHYIENPDNKKEVDHINRKRNDNRLINLRWVDSSENNQNKSFQKNNKLKIKNITFQRNRYQYKKTIRGITEYKYFKTLEEAIEFKNLKLL